jgi:exosortase
MTGNEGASGSGTRLTWTRDSWVAAATAAVVCIVLLGAVRYCPNYQSGKITLFAQWLTTFWSDIVTQVTSIFSGTSKESLSGEATASEFNYCALVPFIAAFLVYTRWDQVRAVAGPGSTSGFGLLGGGLFTYLVGFLMENYYVGMFALELVYAGLIVLFLGWPTLRILWFPVAFLLFMWPYNFMEDVALQLRLVMSSLSHEILRTIGVPNVLQGTALLSPPNSPLPFAIDIADPCSGIRGLFAIAMLAAVYAFIAFEKLWHQAVIIALAIPMVIVGNLVRIVGLTLATIHLGEKFALGTNSAPSWFHEGLGYLVYGIAFGGLIGLGNVLIRISASESSHA